MANKFGGPYTDKKVEKLAQYLGAFTTALKDRPFNLVFIDAFAGSGDRTTIRVSAPDFFGDGRKIITTAGSARRALETSPPFKMNVFIEKDPELFKELQSVRAEFPDAKVELINGDANKYVVRLCNRIDWNQPHGKLKGIRGVIFLDPFGMEINWNTLKVVAETRALDAWIFFPLMGLYRNSPHDRLALDDSKRKSITKVLGTPEWENDWYNHRPTGQQDMFEDMNPKNQTRSLDVDGIEAYVQDRLKTIFKGTVLKPLRINNTRGSPIASLFFCVSNESPAAVRVATDIAGHILKSGM
ncbi:MAG: three-Cys-motif partner protein TcmP [Rhizobiaceae bacterium]